nr:ASCH domain-containing protein [uncultured Rhodopila sp.]
MKAITVRQPWAWLLIQGTKDIENRDWPTNVRGQVAIHAAKGMTRFEYEDAWEFVAHFDPLLAWQMPLPKELVRGAIIGTMILRDCVTSSKSPWFQGRYGFVLDTPEPWDSYPISGQLGFWEVPESAFEVEDFGGPR